MRPAVAVVIERRGDIVIVRTADGQEAHWPMATAAAVVTALLADGEVAARVRGKS